MDLQTTHLNLNIEGKEFRVDMSAILNRQFMKNGVFLASAAFLYNLEKEEALDHSLILDRKNLLSSLSPQDIQAVVTVCPYFAVEEEKRVGVDVFVRKAITLKEFDCGGNLTTFTL